MEMAIANNSRQGLRKTLQAVALALVFGSLAPALMPGGAQAEQQAREQVREPFPENNFGSVAVWINDRFSAAEIEEMPPEFFRIESHACGCADKPAAHFPYLVVVFMTPKGDLVARADGQENVAKFTPLAVRNGDRYCEVESEEQCYGSFASVCEFTDFRYGPLLKEFFPTCK